ncbi:MAG TPA: CapA family protein [Spirochaetes bacterium]|nr:CapA family protein [Spirochaetota bacterium]
MIRLELKHRVIALILALAAAGGGRCARMEEHCAVTLAFAGDIIMHIPVKTCAMRRDVKDEKGNSLNNSGFDYLFEKIAPEFAGCDAVQGNMEFPVSPPYTSKPWVFNCVPEVLPALKKAGFTMLTVANNHILDQGKEGLLSSIWLLNKYGLVPLGAGATETEARSGHVLEKNNLRVGFLAYTRTVNRAFPKDKDGIYINNFNKSDRVKEDIAAMRARCDFLVLTVHSGDEYAKSPPAKDRAAFRECLEQGADIIIGHHPHILQEAERYTAGDGRVCHIFYSLGNFISNQSSTFPVKGHTVPLSVRDSAIVKVTLTGKSGNIGRRLTVIPIRTVNEHRPTGRYHRDIQPISLAAEKKTVRAALSAAKLGEQAALEKQLKYLIDKSALIKGVLFGDAIYDDLVFDDER